VESSARRHRCDRDLYALYLGRPAEIPAEVVQASALPALAADEVPSYEVHVAPLVKRYCASCHRAGKKNNNYLMGNYDEVMNSGDNTRMSYRAI